MSEGIDTSHWSGVHNYDTIEETSDFIIIKATEGTNFVDSLFAQNWRGLHGRSIYRGHYHFYRPDLDPILQAKHYYGTTNALQDRAEFPPILDIERLPLKPEHIIATLDHLEELFQEVPIIYTSASIWNTMGIQPWAVKHPLWIANYPYTNWTSDLVEIIKTMKPRLPSTWQSWFMWQWSAYGYGPAFGVEEQSVDLNITPQDVGSYTFIRKPAVEENSTSILPKIPELATGTCLVQNLRIRMHPNTLSKVIGWLGKNEACKIATTKEDGANLWGLIISGNKVGWSAIDHQGNHYIDVNEQPNQQLPTMSVLFRGLRLRTGPGVSHIALAYLPAQAELSVFAIKETTEDIWVACSSKYGAGWVALLLNGRIYLT